MDWAVANCAKGGADVVHVLSVQKFPKEAVASYDSPSPLVVELGQPVGRGRECESAGQRAEAGWAAWLLPAGTGYLRGTASAVLAAEWQRPATLRYLRPASHRPAPAAATPSLAPCTRAALCAVPGAGQAADGAGGRPAGSSGHKVQGLRAAGQLWAGVPPAHRASCALCALAVGTAGAKCRAPVWAVLPSRMRRMCSTV